MGRLASEASEFRGGGRRKKKQRENSRGKKNRRENLNRHERCACFDWELGNGVESEDGRLDAVRPALLDFACFGLLFEDIA